ncbi:ABC transporter substrate-binding protein [Peribacillus butanolivorans]|uniref:ABC transporter substrate-binding protein n=1 Tax=Peribacillus butanolivorans TaxID=421767 RepID=UPI0036479794
MKLKKITIVIALSSLLMIAGCSGSSESSSSAKKSGGESDVIKIGVLQPFSGPNAQAGEETFKGNELAVEEINANGGILGKQVELIKADATNAQEAISEAERLITKEKVDLITGTYLSGLAYPATQIANKYGVLYWETNALAPNITQQGFNNVIRIGISTDPITNVTIDAVENVIAPKLGKSVDELNIVITHEQGLMGTSLGELQEEELKKMGAEVVRIPYDAAAADLSSVVNLLKNENPDIWLRAGYVNDGALLYKQAKDIGWKPKAILGQSDDSKYLLEALGPDGMEGIMSVAFPLYDLNEEYAPGLKAFLKGFQNKYGDAPKLPQTLVAYGGTKILSDIVEKVGVIDVDKIREATLQMDIPVGGTYPTGFGVKLDPKTLDNTRALPVIAQWQDGEIKTIYPPEAVGTDAKLELPLKGW